MSARDPSDERLCTFYLDLNSVLLQQHYLELQSQEAHPNPGHIRGRDEANEPKSDGEELFEKILSGQDWFHHREFLWED